MNTMRGSIAFEVDGAPMAIAFTTNAMVRYQDAANETLLTGLARLKIDPTDIRRIRRMFWAGLSHIPEMTEDKAGDIMDVIGVLEAAKLINVATEAAFPEAKEASGNVPRAAKGPKTR